MEKQTSAATTSYPIIIEQAECAGPSNTDRPLLPREVLDFDITTVGHR